MKKYYKLLPNVNYYISFKIKICIQINNTDINLYKYFLHKINVKYTFDF